MCVTCQMSMLREHEEGPDPDGDQKCACGRFWVGMNDVCGDCFGEQTDGEKCPVSPHLNPAHHPDTSRLSHFVWMHPEAMARKVSPVRLV